MKKTGLRQRRIFSESLKKKVVKDIEKGGLMDKSNDEKFIIN